MLELNKQQMDYLSMVVEKWGVDIVVVVVEHQTKPGIVVEFALFVVDGGLGERRRGRRLD